MSERPTAGRDGFQPHPPEVPMRTPDETPGWLAQPSTIRALKILGLVAVVVLFALDFFVHQHVILGPEATPGWYLLFGFGASVAMILLARGGGNALKRPEDHYDE